MNTIIRGEEAWERLSDIPTVWQGDIVIDLHGPEAAFIEKLQEHYNGTDRLKRIVAAMHDRLIYEREIANLQLMLMLDAVPWRHQIAFVFTESYRRKFKQTGVRWWLHTILDTKIEDIALPPEAEEVAASTAALRTQLYLASESKPLEDIERGDVGD